LMTCSAVDVLLRGPQAIYECVTYCENRSKIKVTDSISPFCTRTAIHRHSLGGVTSRRRGIELCECLLVD